MLKKRLPLALPVLFAACLSFTSTVFAVEITGQIIGLTATKWDVFLFTVSGKNSHIACDSNASYAIPTNTAWGKVAIATVIAAKAAGNNVTVTGEDKCSYWGNAEDMAYIHVN